MEELNNVQLNQYLENIAKLIEATAKDPESAAKIVRDSKVNGDTLPLSEENTDETLEPDNP